MEKERFEIKESELSEIAKNNISEIFPLNKVEKYYVLSLENIYLKLYELYNKDLNKESLKNCLSANKNNRYYLMRKMNMNYFFIVKEKIVLNDIFAGIFEDYQKRFKFKENFYYSYDNNEKSILEQVIRERVLNEQINQIDKVERFKPKI